jgi:RND family efflux transporter MFP subunit
MSGRDGGATAGIPVEAVPVKRETISTYLLTTTTLAPERAVEVVSKTSGLVSQLLVEEGDRVRAGQTLARLDEQELLIALREAEIRAQNMKRIFDRTVEMFEKNLVSKQTYDDAKFNYETAQSQYENAKLRVDYTQIRSPIDGIVTERLVEVGQRINQNQVLFRVGDFDPLLARIFIPEKEIRKLHVGQEAEIVVEAAPDRKFKGVVSMISPVVDPNSGTIKVTLEVRDTSGVLRPGMFANVHIITDTRENVLVIPKKAMVLESERDEVFIVDDGVARRVPVELGYSDGERVEIMSGLSEGQMVVTVGQEGLRDGIPVRIVGQSPRVTEVDTSEAGSRQPKAPAMAAAGRSAPGEGASRPKEGQRRGMAGQMTPERMQRMEKWLLRNPEIRKEFEKRAKEDPDFATNMEKKIQFFREMREKMGMGHRGPGE